MKRTILTMAIAMSLSACGGDNSVTADIVQPVSDDADSSTLDDGGTAGINDSPTNTTSDGGDTVEITEEDSNNTPDDNGTVAIDNDASGTSSDDGQTISDDAGSTTSDDGQTISDDAGSATSDGGQSISDDAGSATSDGGQSVSDDADEITNGTDLDDADDNSIPDGDEVADVTSASLVPETVQIPAGCFDIGSPVTEPLRSSDEGPQTNLCIQAFQMGRFEVTFDQYDAFASQTGRTLPDDEGFGRGARPVINVTWLDASAYTQWLSIQTGGSYRLPTEAEWEYAARAGTTTPFNTGQFITADQANFQATQSFNGSPVGVFRNQTLPVGTFPSNAFGLHDVHGNVQEWTCSTFIGDYRSINAPQLCEPGNTGVRQIRGGTYLSIARNIRSADRNNLSTTFLGRANGFRVVLE